MAKRQEVIRMVNPERKFGFAADAFISAGDLNTFNLAVGDTIEFDEIPGQPGKGPKAANITVVARAALSATQTGQTAPVTQPASTQQPAKPAEVSVEFMTYLEKEVGDKLTFAIAVFVYKGDEHLLGKEVSLKADDKQVKKPAPVLSTDANGRVIFQVSLDKDATECWLVAEVEGKSYSHLWQKGVETDPLLRKKMIEPKTEAIPAAPKAEKISQVGDIHIFRVSWQSNLEIKAESTEQIWVRNLGEDDSKWVSGTSVARTTDDSGRLELEIKMVQSKRGMVHFTTPSWTSQDFYIFPALRLATATKGTKGETK